MILEAPPLALDLVAYAVTGRYGFPKALAPDDVSVLATLMRNHDKPVARESLIQAVYGRGKRPADPADAVRNRMRRLRNVLDSIGGHGMIQSTPGGWMLGKPNDRFNGLHQRWLTDDQVRIFDALAARPDHHA